MSFSTSSRARRFPSRGIVDALESRLQFCALHLAGQEPVELRPDLVPAATSETATSTKAGKAGAKATASGARGGGASSDGADPADIVWVNRATTTAAGAADTDLFGARFGASAPAARAVVDAVIVAYERMIGSFNYGEPGRGYALTVRMGAANSGFGAGAALVASLGGKPQNGIIEIGAGSGTTNGNGWFLDPTPYDSSEFLGTVTNAFAGDALTSSPAAGKSDLYTVVALELTHCMGLSGNNLPGWANHTTDTTIPDTAEGGGVGTLWTFNGPSIKHLLTSNNGGPQGQNLGQAVHSAGPISVSVDGVIYEGAQDQGNAIYETGRRYLVNNVFALMFKDAYGYSSVDPAAFGTFYSTINSTTKALTVRGGATFSADAISITRAGNTVTVSVDVGNDIPGTGALPGSGDLPAFVSYYDISEISSISISSGDLDDSITIDPSIGVPMTVNAGAGIDTVALAGSGGDDTFSLGATNSVLLADGTTMALNSLTGVESLALNGAAGNDTLAFSGTAFPETLMLDAASFSNLINGTFASFESFNVNMGGGTDKIIITSPPGDVNVDGGGGNGDLIDVVETVPGKVVRSTTTLNTDTLKVQLNLTGTGSAVFDVASATSVGQIFVFSGGSIIGNGDLTVGNSVEINPGATVGGAGLLLMPNSTSTFRASGLSVMQLNRRLIGNEVVEINSGTLRLGAGLSVNGPAIRMSRLNLVAAAQAPKLDLTDNTAIIDYTGTSPLATIAAALTTGYAGGEWTGTGIASSTAAATTGRSIGYGEATELFSTFPAAFAGTTIDNTTIVLKYALAADTNFSGAVDFADLVTLSQNYSQSGRTFARGDFNFDGAVGFSDLVILSQQYGQTLMRDPAAIEAASDPVGGRKGQRAAAGVLG
jgi:hypothetical protein